MNLITLFTLMLSLTGMWNVNSINEPTIFSEALAKEYLDDLGVIDYPGDGAMCVGLSDISRINNNPVMHSATLYVVTYHGAHNPPYNVLLLDLQITPNGKKIIKKWIRKNVDIADYCVE